MRIWQEIQAVLWQDHPALNIANVRSSACVLLRVLAAHLFLITDFDELVHSLNSLWVSSFTRDRGRRRIPNSRAYLRFLSRLSNAGRSCQSAAGRLWRGARRNPGTGNAQFKTPPAMYFEPAAFFMARSPTREDAPLRRTFIPSIVQKFWFRISQIAQ
jgi:hypothetical protein